jgi:dTDP-glucose 4,6-dehydratase
MKPYVVIGSNCFTGSHIVNALLREGRRVIGVSRSPEYRDLFLPYKSDKKAASRFEFRRIDMVRKFDALEDFLDEVKPPVVINVAALSEVALSNEKPNDYFATNTTAVVRLCDSLRRRRWLRNYVHISSAEIFGSCAGPVNESALFNPSTPYAVSKAAADMYLATLMTNFGFPATLIRSTNVYGRYQQLFKIIPRTMIYLRLGKTIELHGGGQAVKSFVHIRDVVDGLLLALERDNPGTYHFSVAQDQTIADIVRKVCAWSGYDFDESVRVVDERLGQDARYTLDCSKATGELGWSPRVTFEEGVREVSDWIGTNWKEIQKLPLEYRHKY